MNTGGIDGPYLQSGRVSDRSSYLQEKPLPKGAIRIADLGYFSLDNLLSLNTQGVYWLSKIFSQCQLYDQNEKKWELFELLCSCCDDKLDIPILLGLKERLPCRMLAIRVPEEVARERKRKIRANAIRRGKTPSKSQLKLANWTVLITSVPQEFLTLDEAFILLRVRWQIELLFKLWKSNGKIDDWRSEKPFRILCEFYAKLLAKLYQHWILLSSCWRLENRSIVKASKTIQKHALHLAVAFASFSRERLLEALEIIGRCLVFGCRLNKRKKKPNTYQLLLELT
jgi:hypothetical protein